ncbi:MAG: hypothetical protein GEU88_00185 [Solirubrobacterales bacterium]|nr:hypothetical protein [Solirubrobacterales bacterium]
MSRIQALARHPKRTLGVLAAVLVAVGIAIGSGAQFTAQSANPNNVFSAGALSIDNSKEGAAILTASGMTPGQTVNGTVDIANSGTVAGTFSLSRTNLVDTPPTPALSTQLNVVVSDCGEFVGTTPPTCGDGDDTNVYTGTLAAMNASFGLGSYAPDEQHRFDFAVTLAAGTGDQFQGGESSATFQWNAVSA